MYIKTYLKDIISPFYLFLEKYLNSYDLKKQILAKSSDDFNLKHMI